MNIPIPRLLSALLTLFLITSCSLPECDCTRKLRQCHRMVYERLPSAVEVAANFVVAQIGLLGNQIVGEWKHKAGENFVEGTFMLVINPRATMMFGYCTGKDENG